MGTRCSFLAARLLPALFLSSAATAQQFGEATGRETTQPRTWIVDQAGGGDFTHIRPCIRAASSGDIILVEAGTYGELHIDGKSLTILGNDGAVPIFGGYRHSITGLAKHQFVVLRSVDVRASTGHPSQGPPFLPLVGPAFSLRNNEGQIWIEDSVIQSTRYRPITLEAVDCASLILVRTQLAMSVPPWGAGETVYAVQHQGLVARRSTVHAFESTFAGADLVTCNYNCYEPDGTVAFSGGLGAALRSSFLFASDCTFLGGGGALGRCAFECIVQPGEGGAAIDVDAASEAYAVSSTFVGGPGGPGDACCCGQPTCPDGEAGMPALGEPVIDLGGSARRLAVDTPVGPGQGFYVEASGEPGDDVWTIWSTRIGASFAPAVLGVELGIGTQVVELLGTTDEKGELLANVPVPPLAGALPLGPWTVQGLFQSNGGGAFLGSGSVFVLDDDATVTPGPPRTWLVDAAGGGDFTDLPPCILAARSGDLILVEAGSYTGFTVFRKGLTIVGKDGAVPSVAGAARVHGLAADQSVVLRSLELIRAVSGTGPVLVLEDNDGGVWLEDCRLERAGVAFADALLEVDSCQDVVLVGVECVNESSIFEGAVAGAIVSQSHVQAFDSDFVASDHSPFGSSQPGREGMTVTDSFLYAADCTFQGGKGARADCHEAIGCEPAGDGGDGLAADAGSEVHSLSSTFTAGAGGDPYGTPQCGGPCPGGAPGSPVSGPVDLIPLLPRRLSVESPVAPGGTFELQASALPGEAVWSVWSNDLETEYVPLYFGPRLNAAPYTVVFHGPADGAGQLTLELAVPPITSGLPFEVTYVQGLFYDASSNAYLGSGSALVVVDGL